ncbi:PTS glucitol/sorbitol transporter subunit IIA [Brevibacillus centrosporus]|uniref:PTS glucitol/sorbitol transporter subunit IIA n=1 Tax=Brevibacillus centrosporus TaxID=54910 RepID=UPI002E1D1CF6|nr:PTS glucitol/sorbitol transporter subunit IIA [Brevibacillus centrosporus]
MNTLFTSTVVSIGAMVPDFLNENMLILFNQDAPEELHDMAVLHTKSAHTEEIKPGDILLLGDTQLQVTSVGEKANETLQNIGHCTVKADGSETPQLPGNIHVAKVDFPPLEVGLNVAFIRP